MPVKRKREQFHRLKFNARDKELLRLLEKGREEFIQASAIPVEIPKSVLYVGRHDLFRKYCADHRINYRECRLIREDRDYFGVNPIDWRLVFGYGADLDLIHRLQDYWVAHGGPMDFEYDP